MGWLTAAEALKVLGVRPQTLYANVSRGRIRAKPDPKEARRGLYHEGDVRKIARSRAGARKAERVAAAAIEWGDPILPSGISTVAQGRLWYRGLDAVELAEEQTLEDVAILLWQCGTVSFAGEPRPAGTSRSMRPLDDSSNSTPVLSKMFTAVADRAGRDPPSHGCAPAVLRGEGARVMAALVGSVVGPGEERPLHERLAAAWRCRRAGDVLRRALVLLADHELNASTFAVRVAVSTGASLASGVLAGLATLSGPLHGRAAAGAVELVRAGRQHGMQAAVRERLTCGRELSGFGHPLYPEGDVRAHALLRAIDIPAEYRELRAAAEELAGERPNIDFALAAMTSCCRLPPDAPLVLFALARTVGWLAHALEQISGGHLIRPRARYVGPAVGAGNESNEATAAIGRPDRVIP